MATSYIVDVSDFQGQNGINVLNLKNNGIVGLTSKVGEGADPNFIHYSFINNCNNARNLGLTMYGTYYVVRTNTGYSVQSQVNDYVTLMDQNIPWWRTDPRFICQIDLEHWSYDTVPWDYGIDFGRKLQVAAPIKINKIFLYASEGQYGNTTSEFPQWNANYFDDAPGNYMDLYNLYGGNTSAIWHGSKYTFWQFTQRGYVGNFQGDVSAFRGTTQDLENLIGVTPPVIPYHWYDDSEANA